MTLGIVCHLIVGLEDISEHFRRNLVTLLNERRGCDIYGLIVIIQFTADRTTLHGYDDLEHGFKRQFPVSDEILIGISQQIPVMNGIADDLIQQCLLLVSIVHSSHHPSLGRMVLQTVSLLGIAVRTDL